MQKPIIAVENSNDVEITYRGQKTLAFAVELHEMKYMTEDNIFMIDVMDEAIERRFKDAPLFPFKRHDMSSKYRPTNLAFIETLNNSPFIP